MHLQVFVRLSLTCASQIEVPYYSSRVGMPETCVHCGQTGGSRPQDLVRQFKVVLPVCKDCLEKGKKHITRLPRQVRRQAGGQPRRVETGGGEETGGADAAEGADVAEGADEAGGD